MYIDPSRNKTNTEAVFKVSDGFYVWNYWPEQNPDRITVTIGNVNILVVYSKPPNRDNSFPTPFSFSKIYVASNEEKIKEVFFSIVHKPELNGKSFIKFPELWVFRNDPNLNESNQFQLKFFSSATALQDQIDIDSKTSRENEKNICTII